MAVAEFGVDPAKADSQRSGGIADAKSLKNGRQVAAWLRLVPKQGSSGGKPRLLGMGKRADICLRTLLIHGVRSAIVAA